MYFSWSSIYLYYCSECNLYMYVSYYIFVSFPAYINISLIYCKLGKKSKLYRCSYSIALSSYTIFVFEFKSEVIFFWIYLLDFWISYRYNFALFISTLHFLISLLDWITLAKFSFDLLIIFNESYSHASVVAFMA